MPQCNLLIPEITSKALVKSLIVSYVSFVSNSEQFYNKILAYFERKLKVKETSCKFFYISNLYENKMMHIFGSRSAMKFFRPILESSH